MKSNPGLLDLLDAFESSDAQNESDDLQPAPLVSNCPRSPEISVEANGGCMDPCLDDHNYILKLRKLFMCSKLFIVSSYFLFVDFNKYEVKLLSII